MLRLASNKMHKILMSYLCYKFLSDINECEDEKLNKCLIKSNCENTEGGYTCNKPRSRVKIAIIGMSLCSLIFFFGAKYVTIKFEK